MAQGDTPITVVGNLVADPELRYTPSGSAVANFRVASTPRRYDSQSGQWVDGEALFLTCNVWRQAAENVANSLTKGDRVIVNGRLRQRSFETREGEKRTVFEVEVDEVGPSLKYATSQVTKTPVRAGTSVATRAAVRATPVASRATRAASAARRVRVDRVAVRATRVVSVDAMRPPTMIRGTPHRSPVSTVATSRRSDVRVDLRFRPQIQKP